ncbi:sensor histidine kinase [uncultured Robinsoniella sp.]|uniref:sensor histidine kinase n=1 Tax=uncultured Robinsoniella sp. TaxID=904190 RepID=UPI00374EB87F
MKKIWHNLNMALKLILVFSIVSVIPLLISSFVLYRISAASLEAEMEETTAIFSSQIASDMNQFVSDYDLSTKSLLVNDRLLDNLATDIPISQQVENKLYYRQMVMKLMTMESEIQSITIMNEAGEYYQYDRNGKTLNYEELIQQKWFLDQQQNLDTLFLTPLHDCSYYDKDKDQIIVTFGRKVYGSNGRYAGLILIDLPPASILKLSDAFLLERNQYNIKINITDARGGLIYDSDLSSGRVNYSEINEEELLMYQKDPSNYLVIEDTTEQLGMKINTVIPRSKMLLRVSFIQRVTLLLVIILIVVIISVSILFSKRMLRLIKKLQSSMECLEGGNYELIMDSAGNDEIGSLVKSYNHMVGKMEKLIEEVYQAGIRQKNAQYLALCTQINPHFLFNTLESIRIKAILNGDDTVADMVKLLAKMFRTVLDSDKKNYKVRDELENIRSYIQLQNIRFDNVITLKESIDPQIYHAKFMAILFQPVVENCFKYGSKESGIPIEIWITGQLTEEKKMLFTIQDDGKGMSPERLEAVRQGLYVAQDVEIQKEKGEEESDSHRIGLRNIAERLRLRYGGDGELRIVSSDEHGTIVEIRVPYMD